MKIQWLGTAAAEGWPALFCQCDACMQAAKLGGKNIRMRSGALVDDVLLIDLNPDLYAQKLKFGLDLGNITDILVTHDHSDHFQVDTLELLSEVFGHRKNPVKVHLYAPQDVILKSAVFANNLVLHAVAAGDVIETQSGHRVTVLPAIHSQKNGKFYLIEKGGKSILYAHDTDIFPEQAMEILRREVRFPIGIASLDCTNGPLPHSYMGHMGIEDNAQMRKTLIAEGMADENTRFVCNHFSHNGHLLHEEMSAVCAPLGLEVSYDGMIAEI